MPKTPEYDALLKRPFELNSFGATVVVHSLLDSDTIIMIMGNARALLS